MPICAIGLDIRGGQKYSYTVHDTVKFHTVDKFSGSNDDG